MSLVADSEGLYQTGHMPEDKCGILSWRNKKIPTFREEGYPNKYFSYSWKQYIRGTH